MSGFAQHPFMDKQRLRVGDVETLIREIQRYLGFLDSLRAKPPEPPAERERKSK